jgi:uncharacterized protein with PIN domain
MTTNPTCPRCEHEMTTDEMVEYQGVDLFALAPKEEREEINCPSCGKTYWVQGGYIPTYSCAVDEDDLV